MKTVTILAACTLLGVVGCGPVNPPAEVPFEPGGRATLTYATDLVTRGTAVSESVLLSSDGTEEVIERTETPYAEKYEFRHELALSARSENDRLVVDMVPQRVWVGGELMSPEQAGSFEGDGEGVVAPGAGGKQGYEALLQSRFAAVIEARRLVRVEASGPDFDSVNREQGDAEGRAVALRVHSAGVFPALADALAYLPPEGVTGGTVWQVRRDSVYPYHAYAFYMLTNGAYVMSEHSVCRVEGVRDTQEGRIATVRISGRRTPGAPEPSMSRRVSHLTLKGRLTVNLDTHGISELTLESTPSFTSLTDACMLKVTFHESIRLQPH
jgi:hypothetical protein